MATRLKLLLIKGSEAYDISNIVIQAKWSGRKGSSARTLEATLLDDDNRESMRSGIDVEEGHQCIFSYDGKELFRGIIMTQGQNEKKQLTFKAYDNGIYLANNKDTFQYSNKTASAIFKDVCTRYNIPYSDVAETTYKIPELLKSKTTAFDTVCDALSQDFKATGTRYYITSEKGKLRLLKRSENVVQWVIETGQNLISYNSKKSIEKVKTRIKLLSDEGTVLAEKKNTSLESKIGIMQDVDEPDETLNSAQLQELVSSMLDEKSTPDRNLTTTALGNAEVISGRGVFVVIPALNLSRTYYVEQDAHTFKDNYHSMQLTLTYANELDAFQTSASEAKKSDSKTKGNSVSSLGGYSVGQTVYFHGGTQYGTQTASSPNATDRLAGNATISRITKDAKHPYHLVGAAFNELSGDCNVYGWVDTGSFE